MLYCSTMTNNSDDCLPEAIRDYDFRTSIKSLGNVMCVRGSLPQFKRFLFGTPKLLCLDAVQACSDMEVVNMEVVKEFRSGGCFWVDFCVPSKQWESYFTNDTSKLILCARDVKSGNANKATQFEACEVPDSRQSQNIEVYGWSRQKTPLPCVLKVPKKACHVNKNSKCPISKCKTWKRGSQPVGCCEDSQLVKVAGENYTVVTMKLRMSTFAQKSPSQKSFLQLCIINKEDNTSEWTTQSQCIMVQANSRRYIQLRQYPLKSNTKELETGASMTACHGSGGLNSHDTNHTMDNVITDLDPNFDEDQCNIETGHEPSNELDVAKLAANKPIPNKRKYAEYVSPFDWLHRNMPKPKRFEWRSKLTV